MPNQGDVDYQELHKFDKQADHWWDPQGPFRTLQHINPARLQFIRDQVDLSGLQVLDAGCGGGVLSEALARQGARVLGIDASAACVEAARAHARQAALPLSYQHTTAEQLAEDMPHAFDVVVCMELLEHVPDPASTVAACARLLKPPGTLFLATINRTARAYALAVLGAEYLLGLLPRGTHDYRKFIRPSELAAQLRAANLDLVRLAGLRYHPLTQSARLVDDLAVNYLACARRT